MVDRIENSRRFPRSVAEQPLRCFRCDIDLDDSRPELGKESGREQKCGNNQAHRKQSRLSQTLEPGSVVSAESS